MLCGCAGEVDESSLSTFGPSGGDSDDDSIFDPTTGGQGNGPSETSGATGTGTTGEPPGSTGPVDASSTGEPATTTGQEESSSGGVAADCTPILIEVLYDVSSDDDQLEWIRLHNPCEDPFDLRGYSLAWGGADYSYGGVDLAGVIDAGGCFTVGGPLTGAESGNPVFDQLVDLEPDIQNSGPIADAVALFAVPSASVVGEIPVDAVIYGVSNDSGLVDAEGVAAAPHVGDAPAGSALRRTGPEPSSWAIELPSPGICPPF